MDFFCKKLAFMVDISFLMCYNNAVDSSRVISFESTWMISSVGRATDS